MAWAVLQSSQTSNELTDSDDSMTFVLRIDFVKSTGDPTRPFRTMAGLIESLARLDRELAKSIDAHVESSCVLEKVEASSIKAFIRSLMNSVDDSALRSGEWKQILGSFLVKAKHLILASVGDAKSIAEPGLLDRIQMGVLQEAERTMVRGLPGYVPIPRATLAVQIAAITNSMTPLLQQDVATYESPQEPPVVLNRSLLVNEQELESVLATRVLKNKDQMILKVKKPDFIGSSMWEFQYEGHPITARICNDDWLAEFRRDGLGIRPGSAVRALVGIEQAYDENNEALPAKYTILDVLEVIPPSSALTQLHLGSGTTENIT